MNIGSGLNKKSIYIGDISIKGIVSKDFKKPQYNFKMLQNTSLGLIMNTISPFETSSSGDNVYTVCAVGNFGESSPSNAVTINVTSTGIQDITATATVTAIYDITGRKLRSQADMQSGNIYIVTYSDGNVVKIAK